MSEKSYFFLQELFILASSVPCGELRDSWITKTNESFIIAVEEAKGSILLNLYPLISFISFEYFAI